MANRQKDGGPAFPLDVAVGPAGDFYDSSESHPGMTLRQYYKAAALTGVLAASPVASDRLPGDRIVQMCQEIADAMIAEDEEHNAR